MKLPKEIEEALKKAFSCDQKDRTSTPVIIMRNDPRLAELEAARNAKYDEINAEKDALRKSMDELKERADAYKAEFWVQAEKRMVELDLFTQAEIDENIPFKLSDGVIYRLGDEDESE